MERELSSTLEDYLKAIFHIEKQKKPPGYATFLNMWE